MSGKNNSITLEEIKQALKVIALPSRSSNISTNQYFVNNPNIKSCELTPANATQPDNRLKPSTIRSKAPNKNVVKKSQNR